MTEREPAPAVADIDIYRSAHLLLKQHGKNAAAIAAQRADEMKKRGDLEGHRAWVRIIAAITLLDAEAPEQKH